MPYIPPNQRESLDNSIISLACRILAYVENERAGLLNYTISSLLARLSRGEDLNYNNINRMIGVLECAKLELYRRLASPYEDQKMKANGDVF